MQGKYKKYLYILSLLKLKLHYCKANIKSLEVLVSSKDSSSGIESIFFLWNNTIILAKGNPTIHCFSASHKILTFLYQEVYENRPCLPCVCSRHICLSLIFRTLTMFTHHSTCDRRL